MVNVFTAKKVKSFAVVLIVSLLIPFILSSQVFAKTGTEMKPSSGKGEGMTVRVGFSEFQHFFEVDKDTGEYSGIIYDYMEEIAKYTGWKLEYINVPLEASYEMLEAGELDVLGGTLKNDDTLSRFDFPEYNSGIRYSVLAVKSDNAKYSEFDYQSFQGMRVGQMTRAKQINGQFDRFCLANGITVEKVMYDSGKDCADALQAGKVEAVLTNDIALTTGQRDVARFDSTPYYFAVSKGKVEIVRGINSAISKILEMNPLFDNEIHNKYIKASNDKNVILSATEKEFVKYAGILKVAAVDGAEPVTYFGENGEFAGITADVFETIKRKTGLDFEFVKADSFLQAIEMTKSGETDLLATVSDDTAINDTTIIGEFKMPLSFGYLPIRNVLVTGSGVSAHDLSDKKIALPYGYLTPTEFESSEIIYFNNEDECIRAVNEGKADYTVSASYICEWAIRGGSFGKVAYASLPNRSHPLSIGLGNSASPMLLAIIDKALHSMSDNEIQAIVFENTAMNSYDVTLTEFVHANSLLVFLIVAGVSVILIGVLFVMFRARLKLSRRIAFDGERYRILGEIADEYIYDYDFAEKKFVLSGKLLQLFHKEDEIPKHEVHGRDSLSVTDNVMFSQLLLPSFSKEKGNPNKVSEFQCLLASGETVWFRAVSTVIFQSPGIPIRGMGKLTNIQNDKQELQNMETRANTDSLTGLYTRQYCENDISNYFSKKKGKRTDCLMVIDIDHFKKINDTLGHLFGDKVLCELADTLKREFQFPDLTGRWGGDEFIVFIKNTRGEHDIRVRAGYLCSMMQKEIVGENGASLVMSLSIGICLSSSISDFERMFKYADNALYEVKAEQKNGFKIYNTDEDAASGAKINKDKQR